MGEYATRKSDRKRVKIGTCESMYYLRYEDKDKMKRSKCSLDPSTQKNLFWRLPFPDEDRVLPGNYDDFMKSLRLYKYDEKTKCYTGYSNPELANSGGIIQVRNQESGAMINVPCRHGEKLPDTAGTGIKAFFNGKSHSYELAHIKNTNNGIVPIIRCRDCGHIWRVTWEDIWDYIHLDMQVRLAKYAGKLMHEGKWIPAIEA